MFGWKKAYAPQKEKMYSLPWQHIVIYYRDKTREINRNTVSLFYPAAIFTWLFSIFVGEILSKSAWYICCTYWYILGYLQNLAGLETLYCENIDLYNKFIMYVFLFCRGVQFFFIVYPQGFLKEFQTWTKQTCCYIYKKKIAEDVNWEWQSMP